MRKEEIQSCKECGSSFKTRDKGIFCSHSCSAKYTNRNRPPPTEEQCRKISDSLKKKWKRCPELFPHGIKHSQTVGASTKGKYKGKTITSILDVSGRTVSKILRRLNVGCCICQWKEASCDIHHINGKRIPNANNHSNLTCICPNHHRMYHNGKLDKSQFISLDKYLPINWRDLYYG